MKKSSKTILATFLNIPLIPILLLNSISGFILAAIVPLIKSMLAINQLTNQVKEINEKLAEGVE